MNFEQMPKPPVEEKEKESTIVLGYPDRAVIEKKLQDYEQRLRIQENENKDAYERMDTICKIKISQYLLEKGSISPDEKRFIRQQLAERYGADFRADVYENALNVIEDYIKTRGANTEGGTGLEKKAA